MRVAEGLSSTSWMPKRDKPDRFGIGAHSIVDVRDMSIAVQHQDIPIFWKRSQKPGKPACDRRGNISPQKKPAFSEVLSSSSAWAGMLDGVPTGIRTPIAAVKGQCPNH